VVCSVIKSGSSKKRWEVLTVRGWIVGLVILVVVRFIGQIGAYRYDKGQMGNGTGGLVFDALFTMPHCKISRANTGGWRVGFGRTHANLTAAVCCRFHRHHPPFGSRLHCALGSHWAAIHSPSATGRDQQNGQKSLSCPRHRAGALAFPAAPG
jgi:hypothetical protein